MQIVRFNPFGQVHKGLRALLYDTALQLQQTDFTAEAEIRAAVERVKLVSRLFEHHAHVEDSQVFPLIQEHAPEIVEDFEAQHEADHELAEALEACLFAFNETNGPEQNLAAGNELLQNFHAFLAFNVEHMRKEETIVNSVLWRHYTDGQLLRKVQEIGAAIPPEENKHFIFWMLKGLGTGEIIDWFNAIRVSAPPPMVLFFNSLAGEALPAGKWNRIQAALQESAVLA